MFPETVRNVCGSVSSFVSNGAKLSYSYGRSALWVVASSATILVIPVIFESERAQQQEQQLQQQRQVRVQITYTTIILKKTSRKID